MKGEKAKRSYKIESKPFSEVTDADISLSLQPFIFFLKDANVPAIQPFCRTKTIPFSPYILSLNRWRLTQVSPTLWPGWTTACQAPLSVELSKKNAGLSCHCLLQGVFLTQGSNLCLLHWQANYLSLSHLGPCIIH